MDSPTQAMKSSVSARDAYRSVPIAMRLSRQDVTVFLRSVENPPGATYHARHRIFVQVNRQAGLLLQQQIETANQRAAARHHDTAIHDVRRELGRRDLQRAPDRVDNLLNRLLHRLANFARMHAHDLRNAGHEIATLHFHLALFADRRRGADLNLDLLGGRLADEQVVVLAHELHDRLIELVTAGADRRVGHDARQRNHRDLRRAAADVDDHVPRRRFDREADADRRGHRLRHHVDLFRAGRLRRVTHRALLDFGDPRRDAHDDFRSDAEEMAIDDRLEEEPEHLLGHVEVGDDAVLQRPNREHTVGRAPEHALRFEADAFDFAGSFFDRDDGRLVEHDPFAANVDECVSGTKIDGDFVRRTPGTHFKIQPAWWHVIVGKIVWRATANGHKVMKCVTPSKREA